MDRFFLFVGSTQLDAATSKLKASGLFYRQKRLESRAENWQVIVELLKDPALVGVVVKLTADNYRTLLDPGYEEVSRALLAALSAVPHVVFVHESVLAGEQEPPEAAEAVNVFDDEEEESYYEYLANHYFSSPPEDVRVSVNALLEEHSIQVVPYRTNAELSVLSAAFIDDNEKNLLFRLYVPNGRIYASEAEKLLAMFRDWLTTVRGQRVRQAGYHTGNGQVFELFGEERANSVELSAEFDDFSRFVDLSVDDPDSARNQLTALGIEKSVAEDIVRRYGRETRRLHLDLRHAREARLLSIRQRVEAELVDLLEPGGPEWHEIDRMLEVGVPGAPGVRTALAPGEPVPAAPSGNVTINQQIINTVEGNLLQGVRGTVNLGPQAQELLELVRNFGGQEANELESAVHELEDADARHADRLRARQRLKGFVIRLGGKVEETALNVLQTYLENAIL